MAEATAPDGIDPSPCAVETGQLGPRSGIATRAGASAGRDAARTSISLGGIPPGVRVEFGPEAGLSRTPGASQKRAKACAATGVHSGTTTARWGRAGAAADAGSLHHPAQELCSGRPPEARDHQQARVR